MIDTGDTGDTGFFYKGTKLSPICEKAVSIFATDDTGKKQKTVFPLKCHPKAF